MVQGWVQMPTPLLTSWVVSDKSSNCTVLCFPHMQNEDEHCLSLGLSSGSRYMDKTL